jgi:pimeloyl-ACP methyl ester carboxylesterase
LACAISWTFGAGCGDVSPARPLADSGTGPPACTVTAESTTVHDDWNGTGIEVTELRPVQWSASEHPTLLFGHGNDLFPDSYACYRELLAESCVRTIVPRLWNTDDGDLPHLGWEARQLRWDDTLAIYDELAAQQEHELIFVGGHSMGAYSALLAAGADSIIGGDQVECEPIDAAGYVIISGWPAQNAVADPPFWFAEHAFEELRPNRFVAYGELDVSSGDPCLEVSPPSCRGDSYWIDEQEAEDANLEHVLVTAFEHCDFACGPDWREDHPDPAGIEAFVGDLGAWIWHTVGTEHLEDGD